MLNSARFVFKLKCMSVLLITFGVSTFCLLGLIALSETDISTLKDKVELKEDIGKIIVGLNQNKEDIHWSTYFNMQENEVLKIVEDKVDTSATGTYELKVKTLNGNGVETHSETVFEVDVVDEDKLNIAWKSFVGYGLPNFDGSLYGEYSEQAAEAYKNVLKDEIGIITFETETDYQKLKNLFASQFSCPVVDEKEENGKITVSYKYSDGQAYFNETGLNTKINEIASEINDKGDYETALIEDVIAWVSCNIAPIDTETDLETVLENKKGTVLEINKLVKELLNCYNIQSTICKGMYNDNPHNWLKVQFENGDTAYYDPVLYKTKKDGEWLNVKKLWNTHTLSGVVE